MGLMLSKTYAVLRSVGASENDAREAAEEIASYEKRLIRVEVITGTTLIGVVALLVKAFYP